MTVPGHVLVVKRIRRDPAKVEAEVQILSGTLMELSKYQTKAFTFMADPDKNTLIRCILGLVGESGEVAEKLKKYYRGDSEALQDLTAELGDVLWYLAALATVLGLDLDEIAEENIKKLSSRKARGVIKGSGDNR